MNKSKAELYILKANDNDRQDELANYDETKSLAYLYKIFEEMSTHKGDKVEKNSEHLDEIFNETTLTKYLKFYLKGGNSDIIFISCILALEPFSSFSHDTLHTATLLENVFTKKEHTSLKTTKGFKSKYFEIRKQIEELKHKLESLNDPRVRQSVLNSHYDINAKKLDIAEKIAKLQQKILTAEWARLINAKTRDSLGNYEDSGLMSFNENDISKGFFDIGKSLF